MTQATQDVFFMRRESSQLTLGPKAKRNKNGKHPKSRKFVRWQQCTMKPRAWTNSYQRCLFLKLLRDDSCEDVRDRTKSAHKSPNLDLLPLWHQPWVSTQLGSTAPAISRIFGPSAISNHSTASCVRIPTTTPSLSKVFW